MEDRLALGFERNEEGEGGGGSGSGNFEKVGSSGSCAEGDWVQCEGATFFLTFEGGKGGGGVRRDRGDAFES